MKSVMRQPQRQRTAAADRYPPNMKSALFRPVEGRVVGGVCAALAFRFGLDTPSLRLATVLATIFFGVTIPLYLILWVLIPSAGDAR
jgi:phage shock protein PspC (stress-responsive transcriptional regulator)